MEFSKEYEELQQQGKRVSLFKKKSESLSRLKLHFFEKMKKAEDVEDVNQARAYYGYLIRAMKLSSQIYFRMQEEITKYSHQYSHQSFSSYELQQQLNSCNTPAFTQLKETLFTFHSSLSRYQNALSTFFIDVSQSHSPIITLQTIIENEVELFNDIENYNSDFFKKFEDQQRIHQLLLEEKKVSDQFIARIEILEKETTTFAQNIKNKTYEIKQAMSGLVREMQQNPKGTAIYPIQQLAHVFEKHASIIAVTVIGLGIAANLSTLAGLGSVAVTAKTIMDVLSHSLEGVEAFPALQAVAHKSQSLISKTIIQVQYSLQDVFSFKSSNIAT